MHNKDEIISANEINRFCYCPYQWYYNRVYGSKEIQSRYKKRNEKYGYTDVVEANFTRGQRFHTDYHRSYRRTGIIKIIVYFIIAAVLTYWFVRLIGNG